MLIALLCLKTLFVSSYQLPAETGKPIEPIEGFEDRLSEAIRYQTVNNYNPAQDSVVFMRFHTFLKQNFPHVFTYLLTENFPQYALMFFIKGTSNDLKPLLLLAHQDVVPADSLQWKKTPFAGIDDGTFVWGRGTLDDKGSLMAILEAVEILLKDGFAPSRSIYLAFGADEERDGLGAAAMAHWMKIHRISPEMVLDEGLVITHGMVPGIDKPVALIGTSEKGYASIQLKVKMAGGHSSTPEKETAISVLSTAVLKVVDRLPETRISEPVDDFMDYLCPETPWPLRIVFANRWLFSGPITSIYKQTASGSALVMTTAAPTVLKAGETDNVLPFEAMAVINSRILPGETTAQLMERINAMIDDSRVKTGFISTRIDPSPVSPVGSNSFNTLAISIREQFPDVLVMPNLMIATSDSRHYSIVSDNVYRFAPYSLHASDLEGIHGIDEHIRISDYKNMIAFYTRLLRNFAEKGQKK
jgi:carboxypeptidase PM20D1